MRNPEDELRSFEQSAGQEEVKVESITPGHVLHHLTLLRQDMIRLREADEKRMRTLEKTVYGNGSPGLAEDARTIKRELEFIRRVGLAIMVAAILGTGSVVWETIRGSIVASAQAVEGP